MNHCCNLGKELKNEKNILFETDKFFLVPALGQIGIEGYLLLCSKKHSLGIASLNCNSELEELINKILGVFKSTYNKPAIIFEHVARHPEHKRSNSLDHAHMHIIPINIDIIEILGSSLELVRINEYADVINKHNTSDDSYYVIQDNYGDKYFASHYRDMPSQIIRKEIAEKNNNEKWDWREYPDHETFKKTMDRLCDKF